MPSPLLSFPQAGLASQVVSSSHDAPHASRTFGEQGWVTSRDRRRARVSPLEWWSARRAGIWAAVRRGFRRDIPIRKRNQADSETMGLVLRLRSARRVRAQPDWGAHKSRNEGGKAAGQTSGPSIQAHTPASATRQGTDQLRQGKPQSGRRTVRGRCKDVTTGSRCLKGALKSWMGQSTHGLRIVTPMPSKSFTLRVTKVRPGVVPEFETRD